MKFPESGELKREVYAIVQNGWRQEHGEAEKLLQENALCLLEFKKGTELAHCDFDFGRKIEYLAEKEYPSPIAYTLFTMIELQARYRERQARFQTAVDLYLASLVYAKHLSQDNTVQSKLMGYIIGHEAVKRLKSYLNNNQFQTRQCPKIIERLNAHDISSALKEIHEAQRDWVKSIIKKTADIFMISVTEKFRDHPEILSNAVQFRKEYIARAYEDIDYYYGNFIKAAQTRKKQDWEFANSEAEKFKMKIQKEPSGESEGLIICFLKDPDNPNPPCAQIIRLLLSSAIASYDHLMSSYDQNLRQLQETRALAESKCP